MTGKIDKVAHSMGYAFAYGVAQAVLQSDILAEGNTLGRFYVLAPENGCSAPAFELSNFEEIWQYGTNEAVDLLWEQDGVAPQCAITGLDFDVISANYGRLPYLGDPNNKDFTKAHLSENYSWLFNENILPPGFRGYAKSR